MKPGKPFLITIFPVLLLFLISFSLKSHDGILRLIQVQKNQSGLENVLKRLRLECLQEMSGSYLLRVDTRELLALRNRGIKLRTLGFFDRKKIYLVARITTSSDLNQVRNLLVVINLEGNDYLLIAENSSVVDMLPLSVRKRILPSTGLAFRGTVSIPEQFSWRQALDEILQQIADEVSTDNLRTYVTALQNFGTRYTLTANCLQAAQYIYDYFLSLGLEPEFQDFTYGGVISGRNVVAEIRGLTYPEQVVIICAHYDSTSDQRWTLAPGADDNASGTAAVMEAARILNTFPLDFTVRFIAFSAEEQGLIGSLSYVQIKLSPEEEIIGVVNLDMIAYADQMPEDLDVIGNSNSSWLVDRVVAMTATYGPAPGKKIINPSFVYSDHASFWDRGISAICAIEDADVPNPYYHRTTDTVDTLNFEFFQSSTRGGLVALADLGQLIKPGFPPTPRNFNLKTSTYASIFNYIRKVLLTWEAEPGVAGYNIYRSNYSHGNYQKLNSGLILEAEFADLLYSADVPYYYVVTSVDSLNRESNYSRQLLITTGIKFETVVNTLFLNSFGH